ncbi:hypothetical protein Sant_1801 [Sodalis praecaptivus]|uniref:Uncharacterized protein n=1 Tax=Sodalis praecaptivus TaxID=1239307 RepID=W0HSU0_9GAMM|nr:hypothetical protein [Sodalis praecaptivus]AHF76854.1 hypothetical protein Sant_1801 [Sodalis praecaptivus]
MNTISDSALSLINGKTKYDHAPHSDSASTGRPGCQTLFLALMNHRDKLEAVSNTSYPQGPSTAGPQQSRMPQSDSQEHQAAAQEQQRNRSLPPHHPEKVGCMATPQEKAVGSAEIKNEHRFPTNIFSLLKAIDQTSNPEKASRELMNRWSVPLNIAANNANLWRNEAIADIERLQQLCLQPEINEGELNRVYARLINNMNAHYDCLRQRDSLLFQSNLLSKKILLIRKSRQRKSNNLPSTAVGAGNVMSADSTGPRSAYNESRERCGKDATVSPDITSAKKRKTI